MLPTRMLRAAFARTKQATGITGLAIHPTPFQALRETYGSTLSQLQAMPPSAIYRQATEAVTNQRLSLIDACEAKATASNGEAVIAEFENEIEEAHCIEEVIDAAETELELVKKMSEWKAWEALQTPAPPGQWEGFNVPASTSMPEP